MRSSSAGETAQSDSEDIESRNLQTFKYVLSRKINSIFKASGTYNFFHMSRWPLQSNTQSKEVKLTAGEEREKEGR